MLLTDDLSTCCEMPFDMLTLAQVKALVPSTNKAFPKPMLTDPWHHMELLRHNHLIICPRHIYFALIRAYCILYAGYTVLIGPPYHWSPQRYPGYTILTNPLSPNVTLDTVLIGPPPPPRIHNSHWFPISLVPQCNLGYSSNWSPISLVPQRHPGYIILIGPPSHRSPSFLSCSHWPISLVPPHNKVWLLD